MTPRSHRRRPARARRGGLLGVVASLLVVAACGSDDSGTAELSGVVRNPAPVVDGTTLPSLSDPGNEVTFRADDGGIKVVYFGFTNCPDVCPTTLADFSVALRRMDPTLAADVDLVMATVDPDRDLDVLDRYVTSFVSDAQAAGTTDEQLLLDAAEPFGASWEVRRLDDGRIEVDHTPFLYAVDDAGRLLLTWQFGATAEDMAGDLETLLTREATA
ncbi:MAG: SCO family protein [Actinomycetota bacterium]